MRNTFNYLHVGVADTPLCALGRGHYYQYSIHTFAVAAVYTAGVVSL